MKSKIILFTFILFFFSGHIEAQYKRATIWTNDMKNFAAEDAINGAPQEVVLFAGSSTLRMWTSLQTDFPKSKVLNRAFGGSWMTDIIYFFNQVVVPYAPQQVVLYEGDNDLMEPSKTPQSFMDDVITATRMINIHFPETEIILVSIKPSPSRKSAFPKYLEANNLMKSYAESIHYIKFVDVWDAMLNSDNTPNTSLYLSDMLHMNREGYDIWKKILEPHLLTSAEPVQEIDKVIYTDSSHPSYHDYSWINVIAPSEFNSSRADKIGSENTWVHRGESALKISYKGVFEGNWKACVAAPSWTIFDVTNCKELEFWIYSKTDIAGTELPFLYLESKTGSTTNKIKLSDYISKVSANIWNKVTIPVTAWKDVSPDFTYNNVKTLFFSQYNINKNTVTFYIDDLIFRTEKNEPTGNSDIYIDFGSNASLSAKNWNNVADHQAAEIELKDKEGLKSGITLKVTDSFFNGYNNNGTSSTSGAASEFITNAAQDNFFGHGTNWGATPANPIGVIQFTGLDANATYNFTFFASRMGVSDNREALYSVSNNTDTKSTVLNSSNNIENVAKIINLKPSTQGVLTLKVEAGNNNNNGIKFFYIGAMKIAKIDNSNSIKNNKVENQPIYYSQNNLYMSDYTGNIEVYELSGKKVSEGVAVLGAYKVSLRSGIYIVKTTLSNQKIVVN